MKPRAPQIAVGALPLLIGGLAVLPGALLATIGPAAPAGAACAPHTTVAAHHAHANARAKIHRSAPTVTRRHKHKYVARVLLSATQGSAKVKLVVSVCPDGAAGGAATVTQRGTGRGVTHRTVSGTGRTAAAARKDARQAAARATVALKRSSTSTKARHRAEKRAIRVAKTVAKSGAHDTLYRSQVVYAVLGADGVYRLATTPPAGQVTLTASAGGDLVLTVPTGFVPKSATSWACIRRAPAWPTSFVFDGGDVIAPALQAAAAAATVSAPYGIGGAPWGDPTGVASGQEPVADQSWYGGWHSGTGGYDASVAADTPAPGPLVCLRPGYPVGTGYTAVLHGAHVGTATVSTGGDLRVPAGLPIQLR